MNPRIVFIPGVGADRRAFTKLQLTENYVPVYADWIPLERKTESFESYCSRLIKTYQIVETDILVGLSFGGLVAQQISLKLKIRKVILLSGFRNKTDLRWLWNFCLTRKLYRIVPNKNTTLIISIARFFLHSWRKKSAKVLGDMMKDSDFTFIKWSLKQIESVDLKHNYQENYLSLIGSGDLLIKSWTSEEFIIEKGTHFMVYDQAKTINDAMIRYIS